MLFSRVSSKVPPLALPCGRPCPEQLRIHMLWLLFHYCIVLYWTQTQMLSSALFDLTWFDCSSISIDVWAKVFQPKSCLFSILESTISAWKWKKNWHTYFSLKHWTYSWVGCWFSWLKKEKGRLVIKTVERERVRARIRIKGVEELCHE